MHESLGTRQYNSEVIPKHVLTMQYCYKHCILSNLGGGALLMKSWKDEAAIQIIKHKVTKY